MTFFFFVSSSKLNNHADDNTLYASDYNLEEVKKVLLNDLNKVTELFFENYMVLKTGKCHLCLGKNTENETFIFNDTHINNNKEEKILGATTDKKMTFSNHIRELCKKASQKILVLSRISNQPKDSEKKLFNAVIKSQFNYCLFVWMFCLRTLNNMINKVHERALRVTLGDDLSDSESLLQNNKNTIEMFKIKHELALPIMGSMFERRNDSYNLRNFQGSLTERKRRVP